jgi:hypothetical protein
MQANRPTPKKKPVSGERPATTPQSANPKLPFEGEADEEASKTGFPGQADERTNLDQDGNYSQAGKKPPGRTGGSE